MSLNYKIYINGILQGETEELSWNISSIYTTPYNEPFAGGYYLPMPYSTIMYWRVDVYDTETELMATGDTWIFTTQTLYFGDKEVIDGITGDRSLVVDPTLDWFWEDGAWGSYPDILVKGGGRYKNNLVVISKDTDGKGKILWA